VPDVEGSTFPNTIGKATVGARHLIANWESACGRRVPGAIGAWRCPEGASGEFVVADVLPYPHSLLLLPLSTIIIASEQAALTPACTMVRSTSCLLLLY
jgi:hypothetical protein